MHDEYFEGILQLRNPHKEVIDFIENQSARAKDNSISKIVKQKQGYDYYFSSKKFLHQLAKRLQDSFGGELSTNPRIHTRNRQTSKDVYRINVLFRLFDFKKDDIIKIDDKIVKITKISKNISGIDVTNNKKITFNIKNKTYKVLEIKKTIVTKVKPSIEILDPETYQSTKVENMPKVNIGEKVNVVVSNGVWIV